MMGDAQSDARIVEMVIRRIDDGSPGYRLENPFGETVQVLPTPPAFRATLSLQWEGAMPDEIVALMARAKSSGVEIGS